MKIDKYDYFVPLEHPRKAHQTMKNNIFIKILIWYCLIFIYVFIRGEYG